MTTKKKLMSGVLGKRPGGNDSKPKTVIEQFRDPDIEEIRNLQKSILANAGNMIRSAIMIGGILTRKKSELKHGEFIPWIENNFDFKRSTAANYMRLYEHRESLNVQSVAHLRDALKLISDESQMAKDPSPPKRNPELIYREWKATGKVSQTERLELKIWISNRAQNLKAKAAELEAEALNL